MEGPTSYLVGPFFFRLQYVMLLGHSDHFRHAPVNQTAWGKGVDGASPTLYAFSARA